MRKYSLKEHFQELKNRLITVILFFIVSFVVSYCFKSEIFYFLLRPLSELIETGERKIIFTGLSEAFFSYIRLSFFISFCSTLPLISQQIYGFISPGLVNSERKILVIMLTMSPILFFSGTFFMFYFIMPKAWFFFLSYENTDSLLPIILEARISEYLTLVIQLTTAFGIAFQLPILMLILASLGLISSESLIKRRRFSIVVIFIAAGILTPPDVISQIGLALPLLLLYEISILLCKLFYKKDLVSKGY